MPQSHMTIIPIPSSELKNGAKSLTIDYFYYSTVFGKALIACTPKGICFVAFGKAANTFPKLKRMFPKATFTEQSHRQHLVAVQCIESKNKNKTSLTIYIKGTDFQFRVWHALLEIPRGNLVSYQWIADKVRSPKAVRAVGNAIGSNPIAYLIPCHRVIRSSGQLGGYRWGLHAKLNMIKAEAHKITKY